MNLYRLLVLVEAAIGLFMMIGIGMLIERDVVKPAFAMPAGVVAFGSCCWSFPAGRGSLAGSCSGACAPSADAR